MDEVTYIAEAMHWARTGQSTPPSRVDITKCDCLRVARVMMSKGITVEADALAAGEPG